MSTQRLVTWLVIFFVLTVFTVMSVSGAGYGPSAALAKAVEGDEVLNNSSHVIVVADTDTPEDRKFNSFLRRFSLFNRHHVICSVSARQYQALSLLYTTSTDTLPLDTGNVDVVKVNGPKLSRLDLMRIIRSSSIGDANTHCIALKFNNILYVLLGENIS